jgi:hypothetical protein
MAFLTAIFSALASPFRSGFFRGLAVLVVLGLGAAGPARAAETAPEYQVKAVFLFNFAQFVEWPATAFADSRAPFVIGVLGDDPFGEYLDKLVQSEKVGQRPFEVRRFRKAEDITDCHILFVSHDFTGFDRIAGDLRTRSVLTAGDMDNFSRLGGMVRFVTVNGKIRLRINVAAAQESGLIISSKLLRSATIVTPEKG